MTSSPPAALLDFSGKVAIVTGASGGLGGGIARRFAQAGAAVVLHYHRNQAALLTVVDSLRAEGVKVMALGADLTVPDEVVRFFEESTELQGGLDVLVNNAGIYPSAPLSELSAESWNAVIQANLLSTHLCTQAAAKLMGTNGTAGAIVNVASIEALVPAPLHSHYSAAKAGVLMYTRSAALELGPQGIRVNAVSPGLIWRQGLSEDWPEGVSRYRAKAPLGRLGRAQDVADACLFLSSSAAGWITGANLVVDGGVLATNAFL